MGWCRNYFNPNPTPLISIASIQSSSPAAVSRAVEPGGLSSRATRKQTRARTSRIVEMVTRGGWSKLCTELCTEAVIRADKVESSQECVKACSTSIQVVMI